MTILTSRVAWTKPRDPNRTRRASDLTPQEQAHVRAALRFLRVRHGTTRKLAEAMGVNHRTLRSILSKDRPSAGVALRAARLAGCRVEAILDGVWPPEGACPRCGRS